MKKIKLQIKSRWNNNVLFEYEKEDNTIKDTLEKAIKEGAYLYGANLKGANLEGAYLEGAYLEGAYLEGANLKGAYLYITDNNLEEISEGNEAIKEFEKQTNINILKTYINKHILSPYYLTYWKNGLIIDEYEIVENKKEVKEMTIAQISEALGYDVKIIKEDK